MKLETLTRYDIEALADSALIYQRGVVLADESAVTSLTPVPSGVQATVHGQTGRYSISILTYDDKLAITCSCPYDGDVCKDAVSVLLRTLLKKVEFSAAILDLYKRIKTQAGVAARYCPASLRPCSG